MPSRLSRPPAASMIRRLVACLWSFPYRAICASPPGERRRSRDPARWPEVAVGEGHAAGGNCAGGRLNVGGENGVLAGGAHEVSPWVWLNEGRRFRRAVG